MLNDLCPPKNPAVVGVGVLPTLPPTVPTTQRFVNLIRVVFTKLILDTGAEFISEIDFCAALVRPVNECEQREKWQCLDYRITTNILYIIYSTNQI